MSKGYWLATYKKIESNDNLGNYAAKATETIKSYGGKPLVEGVSIDVLKEAIFQEL